MSELPQVGLFQVLRREFLSGDGNRIDMLSGLQKQHAEHGNAVLQNVGIMKMVNLFGPDANRLVLLDRDRVFSARIPWMQIMGKIFPDGLLLLDGDLHKRHRKIMHLPFRRPELRSYADMMNPMISERLDGMHRAAQPWMAFSSFKELTLDMAATIFLGVDLGADTNKMNGVFEDLVAASMSRVRLRIPGLEYHRGLKGREFMLRFLSELIPLRREGTGADMLTGLCQAVTDEGERLTEQEILDHMIFLMMAAHDTTTSTLTSLTYELAKNPNWQERLREESRGVGSDYVDFDSAGELVGIDLAMKETLRRYPPLPIIPRVATQEVECTGYRIAADTMVVLAPIHTHHMSEWWDEPRKFDPDRFSPERAEDQRHSHSWLPFGGGPHMCLGRKFAELQVRTVMHQLLLRYRFSVPEGYEMPVQQAPISRPRDGLPVTLEPIG